MGATARSVDAAGNTTSRGDGVGLAYDARNRLTQVTLPGGTTRYTYLYNGKGERVGKKNTLAGSPVGASYFVYDEGGRLLGEYTASGAAVAEYLYYNDALYAVATPTDLYYVETDHLGTPRTLWSTARQTVVWSWDALDAKGAFGASAPDADPDHDGVPMVFNPRFPGQYYDAETGLHYNYFRDYDPTTGRYIESDPIGLAGGINTFAYVDSSPMFAADPFGLAPQVQGWWITPPRFNLVRVGLDGLQLVPVHWSWWGYLAFLRVYGHADGFVNIDVGCRAEREDDCGQRSQREWEIHSRINIRYSGYFDWGPNIYATLIGMRAGFVGALGANAALGGAAALQAEYQMLQGANEKAGPVIRQLLQNGPTAMCLLHANAQ